MDSGKKSVLNLTPWQFSFYAMNVLSYSLEFCIPPLTVKREESFAEFEVLFAQHYLKINLVRSRQDLTIWLMSIQVHLMMMLISVGDLNNFVFLTLCIVTNLLLLLDLISV